MDRAERRRRKGNRIKRAIRMAIDWGLSTVWARKNVEHLRSCSCVGCKRFGHEEQALKRRQEKSLIPFDPQDLEPDEF